MDKVILGLSGGVDSAVSALLLQEAGFDVHALYLDIGLPEGISEAEKAARETGVSLRVKDISEELEEKVCVPFAGAYLQGRTPNPCIMCNREVKFAALSSYADEIGAAYIATGHYARVDRENGAVRLLRGRSENDQSYMLSNISFSQLQRLVFPLGGYAKAEVRVLARSRGMSVSDKPDSMEICFIQDENYSDYIGKRGISPEPGNFVGVNGEILGIHRGIHRYTVGQRSGLGISAKTPLYVAELRGETNEVLLTELDGIFRSRIYADAFNWLTPKREGSFRAHVKIRHSKAEYPAEIVPIGDGVEIVFDEPVRAPSPGQAAVLYEGDVLLGGGAISRTER